MFRGLADRDPERPDPEAVRKILLDENLDNALRYVTGPPISANDLRILVTRSTDRLTKRRLRSDDELTVRLLDLVCKLADPLRFPSVSQRRPPQDHELKLAIRATAALHALQTLQTECPSRKFLNWTNRM